MTVAIAILAALGFFALIMASIALHEVGHMVPAKLFGIKVTQYFVGFGKTLWSFRRGETEYGIKAIPLGGYVRLIGMYPPSRRKPNPGPLTRLADSAREAEYWEIGPEDDGRLFHQKPVWQKLIVMFGGPLMNLLLAFCIFTGVNALHGQYVSQPVVRTVSECIVPQGRADTRCQASDPDSPAQKAGLRVGDRIVAFNGTSITEWRQLTDLIRANGDREAVITVEREGKRIDLRTRTVVTGVPDRLDPSKTVEAGFLGVSPTHELQRSGPVQASKDMWTMTKQSVVALSTFPVKVWNVLRDMVTGRERDVNGPISIVGASRVAGEIAVTPDVTPGDRIASWFMMLGSVNLFVALLNLVPLLPLDGGHMAGAVYEWLKRGGARLLRRPDPGHVDTAMMLPVAYLVGGFLLLAGVVLIIADVFFPVKLF